MRYVQDDLISHGSQWQGSAKENEMKHKYLTGVQEQEQSSEFNRPSTLTSVIRNSCCPRNTEWKWRSFYDGYYK